MTSLDFGRDTVYPERQFLSFPPDSAGKFHIKVWKRNTVASLNSLRRSFVIFHVPFDTAAASLNTPQKYVIWNCSYSCHLLWHT